MSLISWEPIDTLSELQKDIDRLFNRKLTPTKRQDLLLEAEWLPPVDIHEDKESYHFEAELPGIDKDKLDVKVQNNQLIISGSRDRNEEEKKKNYFRSERVFGKFVRSFTLPETADSSRVNAEYKNGVLKVSIPKKEEAKPKQIQVKVN